MRRLPARHLFSPAAAAELLLVDRRPDTTRALTRRERRVEGLAALCFVLAAVVMAVKLAPATPVPVGQASALVLAYALLARVRFALGSGFTNPTQLALVPLAMLLAPGLAPMLVGIGLLLARVPDVLLGRARPERLLTSLADGWYVVAPALLLGLVAPHGALVDVAWPVWVAALALQLAGDLVASTVREALGAGVAPRLQAGVIGQVAVVDVLLSPVGLLAAFGSQGRPYAFLLALPLVAGLVVFSRERAARIARALALVDDLDRERERVVAAQRRIGETAAANLDRDALERIIVDTALELVGADGGRLRRINSPHQRPHASSGTDDSAEPAPIAAEGAADLEDALGAAESVLRRRGGHVEASAGGATAIGLAVEGPDVPRCVLTVARRGRGFSDRDWELLATLSEQAAVCLHNLGLHERVKQLAAIDELTGLLNHRRLQEVLEQEVRRAIRYGSPLSLLMLDIDDFKQVNDLHGHQQGDAVLRAVADVVRSSVREVDLPARYGGEELAIALPQMRVAGAVALAERIRRAIAGVAVPGRDGQTLSVTASIGVAELDPAHPVRQELIASADDALYRAKRRGKNRVEAALSEQPGAVA